MAATYPLNWDRYMGVNIFVYDNHGRETGLTDQAMEWAKQLFGLDKNQIEHGFQNLRSRKNGDFPPNALSFRKLCIKTGVSYDQVLDEILTFIGRSSNQEFWWQTREAYSVYMMLHYDKVNPMNSIQVAEKTKRIYNCLDFNSLLEVPPRPAPLKQIAKPVDNKSWVMKKRDFQRRMMESISKIKPELFVNPTGSLSEASPVMKKLFNSYKTQTLISAYDKGNYTDMDKFLKDQGLFA